jgi:hypothetical protein
MLAALYGYSMGLLMFALAGEATTEWLRWLGVIAAVWFILIGSVLGWQAARR